MFSHLCKWVRSACILWFGGPRQTRIGLRPAANADGVALVLVLWVLVILTVIVGEFSAATRSQIQLVGNFKENTQAHYLAASGVEQAIYDMVTDRDFFSLRQPQAPDAEEDRPNWRINGDNPPFQYGPGLFKVRIDNATGKVNINRADRKLLRVMLDGFDIDAQQKDVIVDAIMDWRDKDRFHRINGAEDDYYEDIGAGYLCKDGDFDTIDELRLVRGVTPELLKELEHIVTVYPKSDEDGAPELNSTGEKSPDAVTDWNRINVNAATREVWACFPEMTADDIDAIFEYRRERDIRSLGELAFIISADAYPQVRPHLTLLSSPWFVISAVGAADDSPMIAGLTVTVVKVEGAGQVGAAFRIVEQRPSADARLVARFRSQREIFELLQ